MNLTRKVPDFVTFLFLKRSRTINTQIRKKIVNDNAEQRIQFEGGAIPWVGSKEGPQNVNLNWY